MRRAVTVLLLSLGLAITSAQAPGAHGPEASAADVAPLPAVAAIPADSLVDAFGVGIHLPFLDTPYKDAGAVADALNDLGVRHVRDDLYMANPRQYAGIRQLATRGIKFNLIMGRPTSRESAAAYVETVARELPPGAVESLEGTNEWDHFGGGANWVAEMKQRQRELYTAAKANPATAQLPVLAPSLAFRWNYAAAGDMSQHADKANAHLYPGGWHPSATFAASNPPIRKAQGDLPLVVTEAGYNNAVNTTNGHLPVPEDVGAVYQPRMLLDNLRNGAERTYSYELIDEFLDPGKTNVEANFGLLRRDLTPKPAYDAMKNLLGLASDPGPAFDPGALAYSVEGAGSDVRQLLTQKRDGTFVLLLWRDVPVYNPVTRAKVAVAPQQVRLRLQAPAKMAAYRPSQSPDPIGSGTAAETPLSLAGDVVAVTIDPVVEQTLPVVEPSRDPEPTPPEVEPTPAVEPSRDPVVTPRRVPTRPVITRVAGARKAVALTWKRANGQGSAVTGYQILSGKKRLSVRPSALKAVLRGLPKNKRIRAGVRARNSVGWSTVTWSRVVRTRR